MPDFTPSKPETEQIELLLPEENLKVTQFTEYSFNQNFLSPTDGWSFTVGAEKLSDDMRNGLRPGVFVQLLLNGRTQSSGYIDSVEIGASRDSGTTYRIEGRDKLAQAVDSGADPTQSLKEGQTLASGLVDIFKPFGWQHETDFEISDEANLDVKTQKFRSKTQTSAGKGFGRKALKAYKLHQNRPYTNESVFEFASRITQRFGLWIWLSADGRKLIVSEPNFEQEPSYKIFRNLKGTTNVLDGSVKFDMTDQPTHIIADTYSHSGEFGRGRVKAILKNNVLTAPDNDTEAKRIQAYIKAGATVFEGPKPPPAHNKMTSPRTRIFYLHDDESRDQEQLKAFLLRELAVRQRKSLTANYTVEGHGQNTPEGFAVWSINTVVDVDDEAADLNEPLWIMGRTFNKSRNGGTTTHLELIRLNTLVFSDGGSKSGR